jgi:hypothetical protein
MPPEETAPDSAKPAPAKAAASPDSASRKQETAPLSAITVPVQAAPALSSGCLTCSMISPYDPECAANFLIGKNYTLPAGKLFAYASNRLWLVKKSVGGGDIGLAGGSSLEANALYPSNFMSYEMDRLARRITDSLHMYDFHYYYPYGGG